MSSYPGTDATTRGELSDFLKSRRARIAPASGGLATGPRRRTLGLRREELADLAGVGLTWYTWLEQGRDIRVSPQVLAAIARALQLEPAERAHLFRLAGHAPPAPEPTTAAISPRLQRVLDAWDPFPAHVTGRRRDVLAWNRASEAINGWSRLPDDRRNLLWFVFMVPSTRQLLVEWEKEAPLTVAALRAEAGRDLSAPDYQELITDLLEGSPDFAAIWARQDVRGRREGLKRFQHPEFGCFDLEFTSFQVAEQPSLRLSLHASRRRPQRDDAARDRRPATGSIVTGLKPAPAAASATTARRRSLPRAATRCVCPSPGRRRRPALSSPLAQASSKRYLSWIFCILRESRPERGGETAGVSPFLR